MNNTPAHQSIIRAALEDMFEINERIMTGDICSNKTAIPKARKLLAATAKVLTRQGATNIRLEPYEATGGWVGLTYSYDSPGCDPVCASVVPRRM